MSACKQCRPTRLEYNEMLDEWRQLRARAVAIGRKRRWARDVRNILRQHLCYSSAQLEYPDQVLARLLILIEDLTEHQQLCGCSEP